MISIIRYSDDRVEEWNQFNKQSKNYMFMFDRKYMDYHRDRFKDHSLMFIMTISWFNLPMSEHEGMLISHGGLTYGGFIIDKKMKQHTMNDCFDTLIIYAREKGFKTIRYKCIPHIYHKQSAEEDKFCIVCKWVAQLVTVDVFNLC